MFPHYIQVIHSWLKNDISHVSFSGHHIQRHTMSTGAIFCDHALKVLSDITTV